MPDQHTAPGRPAARAQVIDGLRQLADYLDQHPDVPVNEYGWDLSDYPLLDNDNDGRAEVDRVAAILGVQPDDDTASGGHYTAAKTFGRVTYQYIHVPPRRRAIHQALMSYADSVTPAGQPEAA